MDAVLIPKRKTVLGAISEGDRKEAKALVQTLSQQLVEALSGWMSRIRDIHPDAETILGQSACYNRDAVP